MRILFIKQLFHPEPTARSIDFASELIKNGHEVQVLTSFPSYPFGKIYDGYKQKMFHRETIGEVEVIRVPIYPNQSGKAFHRMLNYMSYAISTTLFGLPRVKRPDVVFAYHGALPVGIPATIYKWFTGVPFVYDVNDIWPDTLQATGMLKNKWMLKFVHLWCQYTYKMAGKITVLSEGFREKLISRNVKPEKVEFINQWSRNKTVDPLSIEDSIKDHFLPEEFNILYAGNVGKAQSLFSIVDSFYELQDDYPKLIFTILGDGVERENLIKYVKDKGINNVKFIDRVDSSLVGKYLYCADVLLVHLKDDPLFRITIPSKIIGCHHAGRPILLGIKGDAENVIKESGAGFIFEPDNVEDLKHKLRQLLTMSKDELREMGKNGKNYYETHFTIETNTQHFIDIFEEIRKK